MEAHGPVLMPEAPMNKAFAADVLHSPNSYPSTGFVGIEAVLHCTTPHVQLHIYGFNWSKKTWRGHNVRHLWRPHSLPVARSAQRGAELHARSRPWHEFTTSVASR